MNNDTVCTCNPGGSYNFNKIEEYELTTDKGKKIIVIYNPKNNEVHINLFRRPPYIEDYIYRDGKFITREVKLALDIDASKNRKYNVLYRSKDKQILKEKDVVFALTKLPKNIQEHIQKPSLDELIR